MIDVVETIRHFNAGRDPDRLAIKYRNLRKSPFIFLRGTCHLFYARSASQGVFFPAPRVWACGDLHLENFGSYKADNRLVYFDINDFDEAALAPASWDVVRLLTSVLVAADTLHATPGQALDLCKVIAEAYGAALVDGKARWIERETAQGLIGELLGRQKSRSRVELLDARTQSKHHRRVIRLDGRHALEASKEDRARVTALIGHFAATQLNPAFFGVLDVARRIAGTGSLGLERHVVLVEGKGSPDGNYLLDLKRALPSSLDPHLDFAQPRWPSQAHRVVTLQRRLQAVSMAFLQPIVDRDASYVLRGLQPSEDRVALDAPDAQPAQIADVLQDMGRILAWGHLRGPGRQGSASADDLIDFGDSRGTWQNDLLPAALHCAGHVTRDWQTFCAAYDSGAFSAP